MHDEHNKINSRDITAGSIEHVSKRKFYFMFLRLERWLTCIQGSTKQYG